MLILTAADLTATRDSGLSISLILAELERAVANAVGEVGVAAEAGSVASSATKLLGLTLHTRDALALGIVSKIERVDIMLLSKISSKYIL